MYFDINNMIIGYVSLVWSKHDIIIMFFLFFFLFFPFPFLFFFSLFFPYLQGYPGAKCPGKMWIHPLFECSDLLIFGVSQNVICPLVECSGLLPYFGVFVSY